MIKCFLSHSSKDKKSYVEIVARLLKKEVKIFDQETFEAGMDTAEEIAKGIDETTLFVIFLSNASLNSDWVKNELTQAKIHFDLGKIEQIYPIIIENGLGYDDARIPEWMRTSLNIQLIIKPSIAAKKINTRLTELSWKIHPRLREQKEIFVGRNEAIQQVEERLDDFSQQTPIALIASGLPAIGRKSFLRHAIKKANLVRSSYEPHVIELSPLENIEDLILKIDDLGIIQENISLLPNMTLEEKNELLKKILVELIGEKERLLINDRGVIVRDDGSLIDWFHKLLVDLALIKTEYLAFCIASQYRLNPSLNYNAPFVYSIAIKELDSNERKGLLNRYTRFHSIELSRDDSSFFSDLLTGYPEQILFTVNLIKDEGILGAKKQSHTIQQYSSDKAKIILDQYQNKTVILEFIYLLCRFDFLSYELLFDIVDEQIYSPILSDLLSASICEKLGVSSDYIRVNEVIRDFVSRSQFKITSSFEQSIQRHVQNFNRSYSGESYDASDYLFSAKESLLSSHNNGLSDDLLLPSIYLKTIKQIYDSKRNYKDVIVLADRVLQREKYLHSVTVDNIRFIKCQSLARINNKDLFFKEVYKVSEPRKSFLHGFYYRLRGDYQKAEASFLKVLDTKFKNQDPRVLGELVLVYMQSDEYDKAFELAKTNYYNRQSNAINANNYFACLITKDRTPENRQELENIIQQLEIDTSERAQEMVASMQVKVAAYYDQDENTLSIIEEAINKFPDIPYPLLTKADLAVHFYNAEKLREAITKLDEVTGKNAQSYRSFIKYKALLLAMEGKTTDAKKLVDKELKGLIPSALQRLNERLDSLGNS